MTCPPSPIFGSLPTVRSWVPGRLGAATCWPSDFGRGLPWSGQQGPKGLRGLQRWSRPLPALTSFTPYRAFCLASSLSPLVRAPPVGIWGSQWPPGHIPTPIPVRSRSIARNWLMLLCVKVPPVPSPPFFFFFFRVWGRTLKLGKRVRVSRRGEMGTGPYGTRWLPLGVQGKRKGNG